MLLHAFTSACLHVCMPCIHVCMPARLHACTSVATARSALGWYRDQCTVGFCIDAGWGAALGRWLHCFAFLFCEFRRGRGRRDGRRRQTNSKHKQAADGSVPGVEPRKRSQFHSRCTTTNHLTTRLLIGLARDNTSDCKFGQNRTPPLCSFFAHTRTRVQVGNECRAGHAPIATTI